MGQNKTHKDYIEIIGETCATGRNYEEKLWNKYYFMSYTYTVNKMLGSVIGGSVIDVGTSHGNWYPFLKQKGFNEIYGVELDSHRAHHAKQLGYTEIYNCDAAHIPHPSNSIDVAVSNDVFVHILKMEDKVSVVREVERILKPGGIFILNHSMSAAFNYEGYTVSKHCSFLSLQEFLLLLLNNTNYEVLDIKPTYFSFRNGRPSFINKMARALIKLPLSVHLLFFLDYFNSRSLPISESDYLYIKLRKRL
jgi:ubiquinone/menaquinone biosynthesis C-methylase UbiE